MVTAFSFMQHTGSLQLSFNKGHFKVQAVRPVDEPVVIAAEGIVHFLPPILKSFYHRLGENAALPGMLAW
jgi:hypothetical protein